jgi:hypothetical protein
MKGKGNPKVLAAARVGRASGGACKVQHGGKGNQPPTQSAAGNPNGANSHGAKVKSPFSKAR